MTWSGAGRPGWRHGRLLVAAVSVVFAASACVTADPGSGPSASPNTAGSAAPSSSPSSTSRPPEPAASSAPATPDGPPSPTVSAVPSPPRRSDEPSLGLISLDASLPFSVAVADSVRAAAAEAGIELVECDAAWSVDGVQDCANVLAQAGVDALISFQPFAALAEEVCTAIDGAPIVGIVFDQGSCEVARLTIDQAESGRLAGAEVGAFAADRWDCEVNAWVSLESSDSDPDGRARMQGYRDGYLEHCPLPERQLTLDGADRLATAEAQVGALLEQLRGRPNIIVGLNESAVLGAMAAVRAAGRESQFWYSGQLADPPIRETIACDRRYIASVAQFPERFGTPLVAAAVDAIEGREVAPEIAAELELVTADNVRDLFPDIPTCDA